MKQKCIISNLNSKKFLKIIITILTISNFNATKCVTKLTLDANITTKTLDKASGNLYIGMATDASAAINTVSRYYGTDTITSNSLVPESDNLINNKAIEYLALSSSNCSKNPLIITSTLSDSGAQSQTSISAFSSNYPNDEKNATSGNIKDSNQSTTSGIVALDASQNYAYALVKPNSGDFGTNGSGLANIKITNGINYGTGITLQQTDAENGTYGIKRAKAIDPSIAQLKIQNDPTITVKNGVVHWDNNLERLYIGINQITTSNTAPGAGAKSVIVASNNNNGSVNFYNIAPDSAFDNTGKQIVGVISNPAGYQTIGVKNLKTMHTSTGKSYLIINGDNSSDTSQPTTDVTPGNKIYALPLVNKLEPDATQGTLANYNDPTFTSPADDPSETLTSDDAPAKVGAGPLPLQSTQNISDMVVVGDTVYASSAQIQATGCEPGIFYSQALFDEYGRIFRWTRWSKRAFPFSGTTDGTVSLFDVDAYNGKIWAVDATAQTNLLSSNWDSKYRNQNMSSTSETSSSSLINILNTNFSNGCFSYLDLDSSTMGLGQFSPGRYVLFGGLSKVAFARISKSLASTEPYNYPIIGEQIPYPQSVMLDFSTPDNFFLTNLPSRSGCVNTLEFSRVYDEAKTLTQGYFFAGTQTGLYAFVQRDGQGFVIDNTVDLLSSAPFTTGLWSKIDAIPGAIIDMASSGNALYVLTFETTAQNPIKNTVYKINFTNNINTMFSENNIKIIAQNMAPATNSDLSLAKMFYAIKVMTKKEESNTTTIEELALATNNGIYCTTITTGFGAASANDQAAALWQPVNEDDTHAYTQLFSPDNNNYNYISTDTSISASSTIWPLQVGDKNSCKTFANNNITQLNGSYYNNLPTFDPEGFNAQDFNCENCINNNFNPLEPITYFWSDGARRFFVVKRACDPTFKSKLFVIPYDIQQWMVTNPKNQIVYDQSLSKVNTFYWLGPIGISGIIIAGTDSGIVALE